MCFKANPAFIKIPGPCLSESETSSNNQFYFFKIPFLLSPKGKIEVSCDNLQHTTVPLTQPAIYIENKDPIPEEQVKKKKRII